MRWQRLPRSSARNCTVRHADPAPLGVPKGWDVADALGDQAFDLQALWEIVEQAAHLPSGGKILEQQQPARLTITARHISEIIATPTRVRWLIRDELERGVIAIMAGKRGTFKSFVAQHWAMRIAQAGEAVFIVSAEGAGFDRRARAWFMKHAKDANATDWPVYVVERRVDFNSDEAIEAVLEEIARLGIKPVLIIIDTLSKNSGRLDADNNAEMGQFIGRIDLKLRKPLDCSVLIVAHTGHGDQTRARGASATEADTDSCYITSKSSDGLVSVTRERFKDAPELPPLNYRVEVMDLGYTDEVGKPVTSCALVATDETPKPAKSDDMPGKAQRQILAALRARTVKDSGRIWSLDEMRKLAIELAIHKSTRKTAVEAVAFSPFMTATLGGYRLND